MGKRSTRALLEHLKYKREKKKEKKKQRKQNNDNEDKINWDTFYGPAQPWSATTLHRHLMVIGVQAQRENNQNQ